MSRFLFVCSLVISSICFGHEDFVKVDEVQLVQVEGVNLLSFSIENKTRENLSNIRLEISVKSQFNRHFGIKELFHDSGRKSFKIEIFDLLHQTIELADIDIEVVEVFGREGHWGHWHGMGQTKQVNTLYSEFYADAPWRMSKYDESGQEQGIPVHFFLHDADLIPALDLKIDNINIRVKSTTDPGFGGVLTYNSIPENEYHDMFSCGSVYDSDLDIKEFDLNSFSASGSQTIDFDIDSDWLDEYVEVTSTYWYFTFTIPPSELVGLTNVVDILVRIEYANLTITDDLIGMRVFRSEEDLPTQTGWYRGDTHLHSMYTQNDAEIGLPLCATKRAGSLIGLDWITTTDHTSDFDNYGNTIATNWTRIQDEATTLNQQDNSLIYVAGQEVAVNNSNSKLVHLLAYPDPNLPTSLPFLGDGDGDIFPTSVSVNDALDQLNQYDGFAYCAHPFATGDELPTIPTNGGIWNLGNAGFPQNGSTYPGNGGLIICNDLGLNSDILSSNSNELVKNGLKGGQIWNSRSNLETGDDELDPWDVQNVGGGFTQEDTSNIEFHFKRFREGQEIINYVNQIGLQQKSLDTSFQNWKFFYSAGSDAHGSFNNSNTSDFASLGTISNNAVGKLSTVVYCPQGMGANGEEVLKALKEGTSSLSDGPLLTIGLSTNGDDNTDEILMGQDTVLDIYSPSNHYLNLDYTSSLEFGDVSDISVVVGTINGEYKKSIPFSGLNGDNTLNLHLADLLDSILGINNAPINEYMYIRAELVSNRDYTGLAEDEYETTYDIFHSITNPIWFKLDDIAGLNELEELIQVYPNPTRQTLTVNFSSDELRTIEIVDFAGRLLLRSLVSDVKCSLDVSEFQSGLYIIRIQSNGREFKTRFVKL